MKNVKYISQEQIDYAPLSHSIILHYTKGITPKCYTFAKKCLIALNCSPKKTYEKNINNSQSQNSLSYYYINVTRIDKFFSTISHKMWCLLL